MAQYDYLRLNEAKFEAGDRWTVETGDLYLIFLEQGTGQLSIPGTGADGFLPVSKPKVAANRGRGCPRPAHELALSAAHPLAPGDVLVLSDAEGARLVPHPGKQMRIRFFSLCVDQLFLLFVGKEFARMQDALDAFKPVKRYPASSALAADCHNLLKGTPPEFNMAHRSQLLRIAASVLTEELKRGPAQRSGFIRMDEHVAQVLETLTADQFLNLSVDEFADRFTCSRRQLNRIFHEHFGLSVVSLRMEMRLLKAASLLRDPDAKILCVAERSGFNHQGLFNTCFKRRFGVSPREWRENMPDAQCPPVKVVNADPSCGMQAAGLCPWALAAPQRKPETVN